MHRTDPAIAASVALPGPPLEKQIEHRLADWRKCYWSIPPPDGVVLYVDTLIKHRGTPDYVRGRLYRSAKQMLQEEARLRAINRRLGELAAEAERRRRKANGGWPVLHVEPPLEEQIGHLARMREQLHWWRRESIRQARDLENFGQELARQSSKLDEQ